MYIGNTFTNFKRFSYDVSAMFFDNTESSRGVTLKAKSSGKMLRELEELPPSHGFGQENLWLLESVMCTIRSVAVLYRVLCPSVSVLTQQTNA